MRRGVLYAVAATAMAALVVAVEMGWQPPALLWDERTRIATRLVLWLEMTIMCVGFASALPPNRAPWRLNTLPGIGAVTIPGMFVLNALALYPRIPLAQAEAKIATGLALGLGLGVIVALLNSFNPEKTPDGDAYQGRGQRRLLISTIAVGIVWAGVVFYPRVPDNGQAQTFLNLRNGVGSLTIGVRKAALLGDSYGVLSISDGINGNGLVLEADEWRPLMDLWTRVRQIEPKGAPMTGEVRDTNMSDPTTVGISSTTSGAHLHISSAHGQTVEFVIDRNRFDEVEAALMKSDQELRK
jgi:hypothetical protein